ncbi:MAG: hypothetical protein ACC628_23365 [Pirellulaceae bacterium]
MNWESLRLARLSLAGKLLVTLFLLLVGPGYLCATANIFFQHQDADLEPGLTLDDLRRTFHGLEKEITPEAKITVTSHMLEHVRPGGEMREYLDRGGEPSIRALITWLEAGAKKEDFAKSDLARAGDPSARQVIADQCIECHNEDGGDAEDVPYAEDAVSDPDYDSVSGVATPEYEREEFGPQVLSLKPTGIKQLVHVTHVHIFTISVFALIVGVLFLMTGFGPKVKLILTPLPMLATVMDIGGWWLARFAEPFIYMIAAAGAIFGTAFALQILGTLASMWLGKAAEPSPSDN